MILFITQKSYFFTIKHFLNSFKNNSEIIYIEEEKRGFIKKYQEIFFYFGPIDFFKLCLLELFCIILYHRNEQKLKTFSIKDCEVNKFINEKLIEKNYSKIISVGCPCKLEAELSEKYSIDIYNLHGGILPYQKGRFSPIKSLKNNHKYIGATLHKISNEIDCGEIVSQDFVLNKNYSPLLAYKEVLKISSNLLSLFLQGKTKFIPNNVHKSLMRF
tara:strand:+ start:393 stop:1040 length:648 start_codon:yes stop_codon:yes gene_type:complete